MRARPLASRVVEAEILDALSPDDLHAVRSRRDLVRLNRLMLHAGTMTASIRSVAGGGAPRSVLEIGCGDGTFMLRVARNLARSWPGVRLVLLDRQGIVTPETVAAIEALGWRAEPAVADVLDYLDQDREPFDVVSANLFLHHFDQGQLEILLGLVAARSRGFAACEPRRAALALAASRLVGLIGCNEVTRHDALASVRAGFAGMELSGSWPKRAGWTLREWRSGPFSHSFTARKVAFTAKKVAFTARKVAFTVGKVGDGL
jgi:SAM-dependent methyltransferase